MKKTAVLSVLTCLVITSGTTLGQEMTDTLNQQDMMALYMELAKPGEEHKLLGKMAGTWEVEISYWTEPGANPMVTTATSVNEMILGGRFLKMHSEGEVMGLKSEGLNIMGFDRRHEVYTIVGYDTWGTYYITAEGTYDDDSGTISMYGEDDDPVMGFTQKYDMNIKFVSDDEIITEIIFKDKINAKGQDEFKMLETVSRRVKE